MATTKITNPDLFDLGSLNTALKLPSGTTAERPTSPSTGEWRYNTTTNLVEFYDGGDWRGLQSEDIPPVNSENFSAVLYTGNGSTQSITGVGFQPDFVWIKERGQAANHRFIDTSRGATKVISSSLANAEFVESTGLTSFDTDGFTLGNNVDYNNNGGTFVAWCWKVNGGTTSSNTDGTITSTVQANTKAGFSIVEYVGNGVAGATIGHGLSAAPEMVIIKNLDSVVDWRVGHTSAGWTKFAKLNQTDAFTTSSTQWNNTAPSSTVVTLGTSSGLNSSGVNYIAYCFHSVAGFSKFGSYTGTGSTTNRPIINTGFEPAFVMIKSASTGGSTPYHWNIYDNKRNTSNPRNLILEADTSDADLTASTAYIDFLSNGFQIGPTTSGRVNGSGITYIYMAFAADASTAPALADSFANALYAGNNTSQSITGLGFQPNLTWIKSQDNTRDHNLTDSVRGVTHPIYITTGAQLTNSTFLTSFDTDGFSLGNQAAVNQLGENFVAWNWKANSAPTINTDGTIQSVVSANQAAGFSIVSYTGTGSAGTIGHGLSAKCDMVIIKTLDSVNDYIVQLPQLGDNARALLNNTNTKSNDATTAQAGNATVFGIGADNSVAKIGDSFIAYCFTSITGFSSFGSYTSNASTKITTGFQPNFFIFKSIGGGDWYIQDSTMSEGVTGIHGGDLIKKYLVANTNAAENSVSTGGVEIMSDGFYPTNWFNTTDGYFYMAFKENPAQYPIPSGEVGYLVVAGGGGGAVTGGAGGAGGLRTTYGTTSGGGSSVESNITLSTQTYTITVGAGGTGLTSGPADGNAGSNSVFGSITSIGGGKGTNSGAGGTGGSGGTGKGGAAGGSGTANQGFNGGLGFGSFTSGGGGGAAQIGQNAPADEEGGDGGNGLTIAITGSNVTYAGGGGGAGGTSLGSGGAGGGGNGGKSSVPATSGTTNTGSGGGAQTNGGSTISGGGGSGVVILRLNTSDYSGTTTGSPTVTTNGSETILTYTGSGTYVHS